MSSPDLASLPKSLSDHVGYLLVRLGKHAQRMFSQAVAPLGLRPAHCDILLLLEAEGALAQVTIAERLLIERPGLVALLDFLEGESLLQRQVDPRDRRRHAVCLTPAGVQRAAELRVVAAQVEASLLADLDELHRGPFREALQRIARNADEGD